MSIQADIIRQALERPTDYLPGWEGRTLLSWERWRAEAVIQALAENGYVIAKVKPTEETLRAWNELCDRGLERLRVKR